MLPRALCVALMLVAGSCAEISLSEAFDDASDGVSLYRVQSLSVPTRSRDAYRTAQNLDNRGRPDNKLGLSLGRLIGCGFDVNAAFAGAFAHERLTWDLGLNPQEGAFETKLGGGSLTVHWDERGPLKLPLMHLHVRVTAQDNTKLSGVIAGAIPKATVRTVLLPAAYRLTTQIVSRDCPEGDCKEGSQGAEIVSYLDKDGDGDITLAEYEGSSFVRNLFESDVDLQNESGAPGRDGEADALSFALSFTAEKIAPPKPTPQERKQPSGL